MIAGMRLLSVSVSMSVRVYIDLSSLFPCVASIPPRLKIFQGRLGNYCFVISKGEFIT